MWLVRKVCFGEPHPLGQTSPIGTKVWPKIFLVGVTDVRVWGVGGGVGGLGSGGMRVVCCVVGGESACFCVCVGVLRRKRAWEGL